jgi:hypothetical protein
MKMLAQKSLLTNPEFTADIAAIGKHPALWEIFRRSTIILLRIRVRELQQRRDRIAHLAGGGK